MYVCMYVCMYVLLMFCRSFSKLSVPAPTGYQHDQIGAFVVSPCTHDKPCPLTSETWCSFSQKVTKCALKVHYTQLIICLHRMYVCMYAVFLNFSLITTMSGLQRFGAQSL